MVTKLWALLGIGSTIVGLSLFNPSTGNFSRSVLFPVARAVAAQPREDGAIGLLSKIEEALIPGFKTLLDTVSERYEREVLIGLQEHTQRSSLLVASLYTTKFDHCESQYIGAGNRFFPLTDGCGFQSLAEGGPR